MAKKKATQKKKAPIKKKASVRLDSVRHKEKRKNIPTEELRDFVRKDDQHGLPVLYPRDPSLDPQLVWKGKDEQDSRDLEVPTVPIYIQEKIHPQHIIEDFLTSLAKPQESNEPQQLELFSDFNGLPEEFDQRVDFYQHDAHWSNRLILGDSLLVMNSLAEKEGLREKVQMIYIDPPYGINFGSNWQVSTRKRQVNDGKVEDTTRQPEQIRAFRDTWKLGIHSYLAYLRDRFQVARDLLAESGSIFVQIGDENVHLVRSLLDEVFGAENFCSQISYRTSVPLTSSGLAGVTDYLLWYARNKPTYKFRDLFQSREEGDKSRYTNVELPNGKRRGLTKEEKEGRVELPPGSRVFSDMDLASSGYTASCTFDFDYCGMKYRTSSGKSWKTTSQGMTRLGQAGRIYDSGRTIRYVIFKQDYPVTKISNLWQDTTGETAKSYVVQTHTKVIERCLLMTTDPGDLVLDPTCGSGTTAFVAELWGRRWITSDTSRVAATLTRTRIMSAQFPYFILRDSPEGTKLEAKLTGTQSVDTEVRGDIRKGLVYKRVPHITLGAIANNEELDAIHAKSLS